MRRDARSAAEPIPESGDFYQALKHTFGDDVSRIELPGPRWSRRGKLYGSVYVLRRLWQQSGLGACVDAAADGDRRLAETAFRLVVCAVLEPGALAQAHRWIWTVAWPGGERTSSREVGAALLWLGLVKERIENNLFLSGRNLFDRQIEHAALLATEEVVVLFRDGARPVAFGWIGAEGGEAAAERLSQRFAPRSLTRHAEPELVAGVRRVFEPVRDCFTGAGEHGGAAVVGFLALALMGELRRRLPVELRASEVLRSLAEVRALEVALGPRRYLVRQKLGGGARQAFRALRLAVPRRVIALD